MNLIYLNNNFFRYFFLNEIVKKYTSNLLNKKLKQLIKKLANFECITPAPQYSDTALNEYFQKKSLKHYDNFKLWLKEGNMTDSLILSISSLTQEDFTKIKENKCCNVLCLVIDAIDKSLITETIKQEYLLNLKLKQVRIETLTAIQVDWIIEDSTFLKAIYYAIEKFATKIEVAPNIIAQNLLNPEVFYLYDKLPKGTPQELSEYGENYMQTFFHRLEVYKESLLCVSALNGDLEMIKKYKHVTNWINGYYVKNSTPLYYACTYGHLEIVKELIEDRKTFDDVHRQTKLNSITLACMKGHLEIVEYYFNLNFNREVFDGLGDSLAHSAVLSKNPKMVQLVFDNGVNFNTLNRHTKQTPLHLSYNSFEITEMLVTKFKVDLELKDEDSYTPLQHFLSQPTFCKRTIELLLEYKCDVSVQDKKGNSIFQLACIYSSKDALEYLIFKNLMSYGPYQIENHPLYLAIKNKNRSTFEFLIENGFDLIEYDKSNRTLFETIINCKDSYIASKYMNANLNNAITQKDLMHLAVIFNFDDVLLSLIEKGFNLEETIKDELTPLLLAFTNDNYFMVKLLLFNGAESEKYHTIKHKKTTFYDYLKRKNLLEYFNKSHFEVVNNNFNCMICLEETNTGIRLPCNSKHCFHSMCVLKWDKNCPLCRKSY